jgi:hypothetical protein
MSYGCPHANVCKKKLHFPGQDFFVKIKNQDEIFYNVSPFSALFFNPNFAIETLQNLPRRGRPKKSQRDFRVLVEVIPKFA